MKCFAQTVDLQDDPDLIRQYEEHHKHVWPEVMRGLRRIGIGRMLIFRFGSRLFMYMEAHDDFDPARDFQTYTADPRCQEWDVLMRRFQQPVPNAAVDTWWMPMQMVFDLSG